MPQAILNRVAFDPPLPPLKFQLIQRIPMRSIIKSMTFYGKPYWREKEMSGQMATKKGPVIFSMDDTKPDGTHPCLIGFITADKANVFAKQSMEERKEHIAKHYEEVFKCPQLALPVHYMDKNWMEEEYSGGCYVSNFLSGVLTQFGNELRKPLNNIYFAGTESANYWAGYMEGAIQAGERSARKILNADGKIRFTKSGKMNRLWATPLKMDVLFIQHILPSVPTAIAFTTATLVGRSLARSVINV